MKTVTAGVSGQRNLTAWIILAGIVLVCHPIVIFAQHAPVSVLPTVAPLTDTDESNAGSGITLASCPGCSSLPPSNSSNGPGLFGYGKFGGPSGCASCGDSGCGEGCGENGCIPGRQPCDTCEGQNRLTRL